MTNLQDTITAPATPAGVSALAVVRVSGKDSITIVNKCFSKNIAKADGYTIHYGHIVDGDQRVDEVLASVFRNPHSYTGEDSVEISGHGSPYITRRIIETLLRNGARMAEPGEFTMRAFLNQKLDLAQAEAVADMISSNSEASLQMALHQMRGGFSNDIAFLRQELIDFAALIELENDFGEEDVEFADREGLKVLIHKLLTQIEKLRSSFASGNVLKNGIRTVLAGKPNAGKSTLLNALLNEERAIVSDIAGTTRDTIEEIFTLNGIQFRLIDTAGLRESTDTIEQIGVGKTKESMRKAELLVYLFDLRCTSPAELAAELKLLPTMEQTILVANKAEETTQMQEDWPENTIFISAKTKKIEPLMQELERVASHYELGNETVVNNVRHADALGKSSEALQKVLSGLDTGLTSDLVALDIRNALYQLGLITGEVTNDEVLDSIFTRFCIGK
ncbi:MAG: tRNA uridine-5-carboxymethylaminomethyl(34) synthesis GTPase MnmE [Bacteroidia bacterium]|jgi:tRNA modification GTPase|nr:tRNA uridine-5-carboxymethylaminomethyl(34) synthesis GTPase MnmE [Bacteroidia bacterium]